MNKYLKNLNRVEFVITYDCTGQCIHCSQGEHKTNKIHLDGKACDMVLRDVMQKYNITSVMTFGGEPLLYPDSVYAIHNVAKNMGIPKRQLITNGYFSLNKEQIQMVAHKIHDCGVNDLLLSVDCFHQKTIPLEPVMDFAKAVKDTGTNIRLNPAWLVGKDDKNEYNIKTRLIVDEFINIGIIEGVGNVVFPEGNAKKYLMEYFEKDKEYINPYSDDPMDVTCISINPDGSVFDGNIYDESILKILKRYDAKKEA